MKLAKATFETVFKVVNDYYQKTLYKDGILLTGSGVKEDTGVKELELKVDIIENLDNTARASDGVWLGIGYKSYDEFRRNISDLVADLFSDDVIKSLEQSEVFNIDIGLVHNCKGGCICEDLEFVCVDGKWA